MIADTGAENGSGYWVQGLESRGLSLESENVFRFRGRV